jgi:hypothetical protein
MFSVKVCRVPYAVVAFCGLLKPGRSYYILTCRMSGTMTISTQHNISEHTVLKKLFPTGLNNGLKFL